MSNFIDPEFHRLFGYPNINVDQAMTGQIMFRESATSAPADETDRKVHIAIGVVAIPNHFNIESHVQYPIMGKLDQDMLKDISIRMSIHKGFKPDLNIGFSLSDLVKQPIWRT